MDKAIRSLLWASSIVFGVSFWSVANAAEIETVKQVTSVSQLSDVRPTDWAF